MAFEHDYQQTLIFLEEAWQLLYARAKFER